ncbi:MAG TPA: recombinase family protein [Propionibacteriaceae bacterium]|nr:recombinase family protein [Propionibacteriaceae bacterium]
MMTSSCRESVHANALIRAGLYLRVSRDRAGLRLAVQRQEDDCRQVAERLGWSVAGMYVDNDLGASGFATKPRAGYKRLLDDLKARRLDAVVVWMEDRSHRQVIELAEFVRTCRAAGIKRYASAGSEYDLSDPDQVTVLFFKARMAEAEVEKISVRVKRKLKELADSGKYHGGPKPYGYEGPTKDEHGAILNRGRAGKAIVDKEAAIIRETAQRVLDGDTLRSIVIDLNRRSVPAPRANLWTRRTLKVILTNPRVAGLRQHQGVIVGKANWPAILDRDTWERVRNVLLSLDRGPARTTSRSYLLSGFIFCGKCDRRLVGMPYPNGARAYGCFIGTTYRGCGGVRRAAEPVETLVREAIFSLFDDNPDLVRALEVTDHEGARELQTLYERLMDDTSALDELTNDYYVNREITKSQFVKSREALEDRMEATKREMAQLDSDRLMTTVLTTVIASENVRDAWENAMLDQRRQLIDALIKKIVVLPQATSKFDPHSILVKWKV